MNKQQTQPIESWIKQNSWNLLVTAALVISAFAITNYRVEAVEKIQKEYPSKDYFDLKFQTLDEQIDEIKDTFKENLEK